MAQNLVEKLVQRYSSGYPEGYKVHSGDYVMIHPKHVMTHDNTGAVIPKFKETGATKLYSPRQVVHTLDHNIQDKSEKNLEKYRKIEEFSKAVGADFYPAGRGIGHQIMIEEGYAFPGTLAVASDSHSNMYGGMGCLGTPVVRTDAAAIWATGKTWWQIPPVAKVILKGEFQPGVSGKDLIITLCGFFSKDEVLNHAVEFTGDGVKYLTVDQRLAVANMTTEWGALVGLFPVDDVTIDWLEKRAKFIALRGLEGVTSDADAVNGVHPRINETTIAALKQDMPNLQPDDGAYYTKVIEIDLSAVEPCVSGPNTVKVMNKVSEIKDKKVKIDKAYLVSCVNSRVEDIAQAAKVLKGNKINPGVKFYVAAASSEVQAESEKRGDWQILMEAGAVPLPPGCGPCIGLGTGLLEAGETGISATNRNFKGRMGSPDAFAYLASPTVVAQSAISGYIDYPEGFNGKNENSAPFVMNLSAPKPAAAVDVKIIDGFPSSLEGELIFCHQDNLNTDGIYPGKYTYQDDITPEGQAAVVMENYDPKFKEMAGAGDILIGGFNFGTGSSREQAATALKYRGISLLIAGSFSETYKRNAINNGFLTIEVPELVDDLKQRFGTENLSVKPGLKLKVDFQSSTVKMEDKIYTFGAVGEAAQELIVAGGLENWVKNNLKS
ncbi:MAG: homoaconitase [Ignavibacteriales bacterium]|nr:MAG: homoaconitase [Ignavibacteriaceae bacterium]MBW7872703.1 homoaconitase [Ignavibacteria bacterium]MCZ2143424.1 homoaconitase [Ignavibacteriales bacterium]OQY73499.1 MAG: homoaconitase [Ignavibacteriales bacterium UTCHB3]MBV6444303.1 3-isopropylmalate dehydratase large subunit [Ignavibacteriaceae bacterium]